VVRGRASGGCISGSPLFSHPPPPCVLAERQLAAEQRCQNVTQEAAEQRCQDALQVPEEAQENMVLRSVERGCASLLMLTLARGRMTLATIKTVVTLHRRDISALRRQAVMSLVSILQASSLFKCLCGETTRYCPNSGTVLRLRCLTIQRSHIA